MIALVEATFAALIIINALGWTDYLTSVELGATNIAVTTFTSLIVLKNIKIIKDDLKGQRGLAIAVVALMIIIASTQIPLIMGYYPSIYVAAPAIPILFIALAKSLIQNPIPS